MDWHCVQAHQSCDEVWARRRFALFLFGVGEEKFLAGGGVEVSAEEAVDEAGEASCGGFVFVEVEGGSGGGDPHGERDGERERDCRSEVILLIGMH